MNYAMTLFLSLAFALFSIASTAQSYQPGVAKFNGTNGMSFPGDEALDLPGYGTIEFWVSAEWQGTPPVHPTVISYLGAEGIIYGVHIAADRQALALSSAAGWGLVPFDFSDGLLHHVAVVTVGDLSEVIIDGVERGVIEAQYGRGPGGLLNIGSLDGSNSPLVGSIAGLRIWDTPLDIEDINGHSLKNILSPDGQGHPELESLVAFSDFDDGRRDFILVDLRVTGDELAAGEPLWNNDTDQDIVIQP